MFQYRQVLVRLRAGDAEREIARSGLMGRDKLTAFRALALRQGWLEADAELPEDAALAGALGAARRARSTISTVEPYRAVVQQWLDAGVDGNISTPTPMVPHSRSLIRSAWRELVSM